ncbi:methyltransferase domain-containing protein [Paenibacillus sp. GYB004]|uniref:class I SAM-dependent methyltransferase n=1 Tax=Paenibacillus sp. GYB004 TaxID=2994393 RepID=UPI002F967148
MSDIVKNQFDSAADRFDSQRERLIPCFDDFYDTAASWIETGEPAPRILDLGAGTGLFAGFARRKFPEAWLTLIDLSDKMIGQARTRFAGDTRVECIVADYTSYSYRGQYDAVISSLSIHHLSHEQKRALFRTVYELLHEGGVFVNADQASGSTPQLDAEYNRRWEMHVHGSGLPAEAIESAIERRKLDRNAPLHAQLDWLREAGFADADCVYKFNEFVVFAARKAGPS